MGQNVAESTNLSKSLKAKGVTRNGKKSSPESDVTADVPSTGSTFTVPDVPSTPKRRKTTAQSANLPITPTPSIIGVLNASDDRNGGDSTPTSFRDRPAEPHRTNAPLATPGGTRVVAYPEEIIESSPSNSRAPRPTTTTSNLLEEACNHLIKVDPRLEPIVRKHYCRMFGPEGLEETIEPFRSLCSGIMAQQVCV